MSNIIFLTKEEAEKNDNIIMYEKLEDVSFKVSDHAIKNAAKRIKNFYKIK